MKTLAFIANGLAISIAAVGLGMATPAFAGTQQEFTTAIKHSQYAAQAPSLKKVHEHLHHVLNCIEGPSGADFDQSAGNPCKGEGNGLLNDFPSGHAEQKDMVKRARILARVGAHVDAFKPAQQIGEAIHGILIKTRAHMGSGM